MKCRRHPEADAIGSCVECGCGVCDTCHVTVAGRIYCRICVEDVVATRLDSRGVAKEITLKDPASAAAMCIFHSGLGQIYNGDIVKGVALILLKWILIITTIACIVKGLYGEVAIFVVVLFAVWAGGIWDAYKRAEDYNRQVTTRSGLQVNGISEFSKLRRN